MVVEAPQSHQHAKANVSATHYVLSALVYKYSALFKALVRDGFRCVVSGEYDAVCVERNKELRLEIAADCDATWTECAHIFPESTNANISGSNAQGDKVPFSPILNNVSLFIA